MKTILLVRHGKTDAQKGAFCGSTNVGLSTEGIRQSHHTIRDLAERKVELVITTGLARTDYYGQLAAEEGIAHVVYKELQELRFGDWEGLTWEEVVAADPLKAEAWLDNPQAMSFPGGETMVGFAERVANGWQRVLEQPYATVALITHSAVASHLLKLTGHNQDLVYLQHGEIVELKV